MHYQLYGVEYTKLIKLTNLERSMFDDDAVPILVRRTYRHLSAGTSVVRTVYITHIINGLVMKICNMELPYY